MAQPTPPTPPTPPAAPDAAESKLEEMMNRILDKRDAVKAAEREANKPKSWVQQLFGE